MGCGATENPVINVNSAIASTITEYFRAHPEIQTLYLRIY